MEIEHYEEASSNHDMVDGDRSYTQKKKSVSAPTSAVSDNSNRSFDCNICLDYARDPVVTLCGHLYCWPCIFKWLHFESTSSPLEPPHQQCPVCKADVSETKLVPLYGRGDFSSEPNSKDSTEVPRRPPNQQLQSRPLNLESQFRSDQRRQLYAPATYSASSSPVFNLGGTTTHPMVWMFGEMVHARVFGNSGEVNLIGYPNSYHHLTGISPRVRRQEMKAEKSLNRISIFLFCCIVLCLLLF